METPPETSGLEPCKGVVGELLSTERPIILAEAAAPGWRTTEFWVSALTIAGTLCGGLVGVLPGKWSAIASTISAVGYALSRAVTKAANDLAATRGNSALAR